VGQVVDDVGGAEKGVAEQGEVALLDGAGVGEDGGGLDAEDAGLAASEVRGRRVRGREQVEDELPDGDGDGAGRGEGEGQLEGGGRGGEVGAVDEGHVQVGVVDGAEGGVDGLGHLVGEVGEGCAGVEDGRGGVVESGGRDGQLRAVGVGDCYAGEVEFEGGVVAP